jgi:hypothetical protein
MAQISPSKNQTRWRRWIFSLAKMSTKRSGRKWNMPFKLHLIIHSKSCFITQKRYRTQAWKNTRFLSELSCFTLRLHYRRQFGPLAIAKRRHKDIIVDVREFLSGLELENGQTRGRFLKPRQYLKTCLLVLSMVHSMATRVWKDGGYNHGTIEGDKYSKPLNFKGRYSMLKFIHLREEAIPH